MSTRSLRDQWQRRINLRATCSTVNRMLLSRGPGSRRPAKKPLLALESKTTRLEWARHHLHRRLHHWRHDIFSAESRYLLHRASGRVSVRREAGQRFQKDCVLPTVAHDGGISACLGCHPLWWPNQYCDLGEKHHCRHLQATDEDRNAFLCQETLGQELSVPT